jgi:hypothetical protein
MNSTSHIENDHRPLALARKYILTRVRVANDRAIQPDLRISPFPFLRDPEHGVGAPINLAKQ